MTESELLERFGVAPGPDALPTIREILRAATEAERDRQGAGDTELMKLCCVQLFCSGKPEDSLVIWRAKASSMDADASIDVQLICGSGLAETKAYLTKVSGDEAAAALKRLALSEAAGDFEGFTVPAYRAGWENYYAEAQ